MARYRSRAPRRRYRKRVRKAPRRLRGKKAGLRPMKQYATIVESVAFSDIKADVPTLHTFTLSQFYRATTVAKNFQFYKAVKVKWEYMPLYNTFQQSNSTAVVSKPQLYFQMCRDQNNQWESFTSNIAKFNIKSTGVDPIGFTKNTEIIYRPNWCSPGISALTFSPVQAVGGGAVDVVTNVIALGLKKQYSWLPTPDLDAYDDPGQYNPIAGATQTTGSPPSLGPTANAGVVYNGHNLYIEQYNEPDVPVCTVLCTVEWQFKGPKNNYNRFSATKPTAPVVE